ncbi:MAG: SDR family NAD(P)-dependent oxidoreductase [Chloroflexota bacterium]
MSLSGQQVLVTGATGFLGGALALRLVADGAQVRALARSPKKAESLRERGIEVSRGDITDPDAVRRAVESCKVVFHVAAAMEGDYTKQESVNVGGTRKLLQAATEAGVERFVHVSSAAVYGYNISGDITEAAPPAPGADPYAVTKTAAEREVLEGNVPFTMIRPGMIYGAGSINWTGAFFRWGRMKPVLFPGRGQGSAFPIHVEDVVDLLVVAAEHPAATGQIFNCAPDPAPTWREFISAYSRLAGHQSWLSIPMQPLYPLAKLAQILSPPQSMARDFPDLLRFAERRITYKMTKARDLLGWSPLYDLERGVASCAPWLRERGLLR